MASVHRNRDKWRVAWRTLEGRQRTRAARTQREAKQIAREIDDALARGQDWYPDWTPDVGYRIVLVTDIVDAYLAERKRTLAGGTWKGDKEQIGQWVAWQTRTYGDNRSPEGVLTKGMLRDFYASLALKANGERRKDSTKKRIVESVQRMWAWAYDEDQFHEAVPRPRRIKMRAGARSVALAPTWAEMDACVHATRGGFAGHAQGYRVASEALYRLAVVLRYTGLRPSQAMRLLWEDFDLAGLQLVVRGELGKTKAEKLGRIVPISEHFRAEMMTWDRQADPEDWVVPTTRVDGPRKRVARQRGMVRAWQRSGVPKAKWHRQSMKAFRKGFQSGLKALGADDEAVRFLVGHDLGVRSHYIDSSAMPLRRAVDLIPPISTRTVAEVIPLAASNS